MELIKMFGNKRQTALALSVSRNTVYYWISRRRVPQWAVDEANRIMEERGKSSKRK